MHEYQPEATVVDLTSIVSFSVHSHAVKFLAEHASYFSESHRRFIVAPSDIQFGMARMFQMLGGETRKALDIVRSMVQVYEALGMDGEVKFERVVLPESKLFELPASLVQPASL